MLTIIDYGSQRGESKHNEYRTQDPPRPRDYGHTVKGKVFWHKMNADINKLVTECDPCQRHHR